MNSYMNSGVPRFQMMVIIAAVNPLLYMCQDEYHNYL